MKLLCIKEKLKNYVSLAERVTGKNTTLPILNSILLVAGNNDLKIRATNLDVGVEFTIPAKIEKKGNVAVPGSVFQNTLSCLSADKQITIELENGNLKINTEHQTVIIKSQQTEDFPTLPKIQNGESFTVPAQKLIQGIRSVVYSAAISDIKPEISSIYIYPENDILVFVATDSFRLAEKKIIQKGLKEFPGVIVPFKNITEILKVFEGVDKDIVVTFNKNQISFYWDEIYLTSRIISGIFPDYKQILPKGHTTEVIVLKQDIVDVLKLINVFSDTFNKVNMVIDPRKNIFTLHSKNDVGENTTNIQATLSGEVIDLSFNYRYIMDCFQSIKSDSVILRFNGENKAMLVSGVGDNSFLYMVMPINK